MTIPMQYLKDDLVSFPCPDLELKGLDLAIQSVKVYLILG